MGRASGLARARPVLDFFWAVRARLFWKGLGSGPAQGQNGQVPGGWAFRLYPGPSLLQTQISHFKNQTMISSKISTNMYDFFHFFIDKSGVHYFFGATFIFYLVDTQW